MPRINGGQSIGGGTGRKHHKRKRGVTSRSHYPARLAARGLSKSPRMRTAEELRRTQRWMLPYIANGIEGGRLYGALKTPIPYSRKSEDEE